MPSLAADTAEAPARPPARPSGRGLLWIYLAVALAVATSLGRVLSVALLEYAPLLLVALSPLGSHLLLVVPLTAMLPFVLVGVARRMAACVVGFGLGREYGDRGVAWAKRRAPRLAPLIDALERTFRHAGAIVLFIAPGPAFCALAGATGMPTWLFLPVALCGQTMWIVLTYLAGDALRDFITPILGFLGEHVLAITIALAIIVGVHQARRISTRRRAALSELHGETRE